MSSHMIRRRVLWTVLVLGSLAGLGWTLRPPPVPVQTVVASRGPLAATVSAEGKTRVKQLYVVSAPVRGTLRRITLRVGDPVTPDSVVARIAPIAAPPLDPRTRAEAVAALAAARAAAARADAAEREATVAAEHADSQLQSLRTEARGGAAPRMEAVHAGHQAEMSHDALDEARAAAREARAQLARAAAVVQTAAGASGGTVIEVRPPAPGRVLQLLRESGGPVAAGTPLLEVGDVARLEIVADLLSSDAAEVQPGAPATITGWGGGPLPARVQRIEPTAFTKVSALGLEEQRAHVILDLIGPPPLHLGQDYRVDVRIVTWQGKNVLRVPSTALFRAGDRWAVYVVRDGRARVATVAIGAADSISTVVRRGLEVGDAVVTEPSDQVRNGVRVRVQPEPTE